MAEEKFAARPPQQQQGGDTSQLQQEVRDLKTPWLHYGPQCHLAFCRFTVAGRAKKWPKPGHRQNKKRHGPKSEPARSASSGPRRSSDHRGREGLTAQPSTSPHKQETTGHYGKLH